MLASRTLFATRAHSVARAAPVAARCFSASAEAIEEPKLKLFGLSGRYAHALFSASNKAGNLEVVEKQMSQFKEVAASPGVSQFLADPSIGRDEKAAQFKEMVGALPKMDPVATNFLSVVADNGRLGDLSKMLDNYDELMRSARGQVTAVVTTADPFPENQKRDLEIALMGLLDDSETLSLSYEVDEEIVGGIKVQVGDKAVDLSVKTKLAKIKELLMASI